jgi:hypothetical protein
MTRANEIKSKILGAQRALLNDQSRTRLLDYNELNCWDEIDELKLEQVRFDDTTCECIAEIFWQSFDSKDEDDERQMSGNATATIAANETVEFSNASASFEGSAARHEPEDPNDEDEQQRRQDEQDYADYITKDW